MSGGRHSPEALAAVVAGVVTLIVVRFGVAGSLPVGGPGVERDHCVGRRVLRDAGHSSN